MMRLPSLGAWAPLVGRGLMWLFAIAVFAHLGGASWYLRDGPPSQATWGWSAMALVAERALAATHPRPAASGAKPCKRVARGVTADGKVILNAASARDLERLPGVGESRARAILKVRQRLGGRFRSLRQLLRVRGIGPRSLKKLTPHLVLDPPPDDRETDGHTKKKPQEGSKRDAAR